MEKETLRTVDDSDLEQLLKNLGVLNAVKSGEAKCKYCKDVITLDNLIALFPEGGNVKFVCNKSECVASFIEARSHRQ